MNELPPQTGDLALFESELRLQGQNAFSGTGTLTFGDDADHALRFSTLAPGHLAPTRLRVSWQEPLSWKVDRRLRNL